MPIDRKLEERIQQILGDPSLYPDSFKSWIPKHMQDNPGFQVIPSQLPAIDRLHAVDVSGGTTGEPQFQSGWVNYAGGNEPARFWKDPWGTVHVSGLIKSGSIGSVAFTLPGGYRPEFTQGFATVSNSLFGYLTVDPNGAITPLAGSNVWFSLAGVSFRSFG